MNTAENELEDAKASVARAQAVLDELQAKADPLQPVPVIPGATAGDPAKVSISSAEPESKDVGDKGMEERANTSGISCSMAGPAACEPENNGTILGDQGMEEHRTDTSGNSLSMPGQAACEPENNGVTLRDEEDTDASKMRGEVSGKQAEKWSTGERNAEPETDKKKRKRETDNDEGEGPKTKKKEKEEQLDEG